MVGEVALMLMPTESGADGHTPARCNTFHRQSFPPQRAAESGD